jgi:hypothetical protein
MWLRGILSVFIFHAMISYGRVDLKFPAHLSTGAKDLIAKLLKPRAEDRIPLRKLLEHSWILQLTLFTGDHFAAMRIVSVGPSGSYIIRLTL